MSGPPPPPARKPPPPPPGGMQRRHVRFDLEAQIELRRGGDVAILPVGNVSAGGVFLKIDRPDAMADFTLGESVSVFLAVDGPDDIAVGMDAEIVRIERGESGRPPGVALMWTSQDPAAVTALARLLGHLAAPDR